MTEQNTRKTHDFRKYLSDLLKEKQEKNPNYSLRSFARAVSVSPSVMSAILTGKRPITEEMKSRIGKQLGLNEKQLAEFTYYPLRREPILFRSKRPVHTITEDVFSYVASWYDLAILELMKLDKFESSIKYVARAFNLTEDKISKTIENLKKFDIIGEDENGEWFNNMGSSAFLSNIFGRLDSSSRKMAQKEFLNLSLRSLDETDAERRNHSAITMAINVADLPKAVEKIKEFRRGLSAELQQTGEFTDVYNLQISFFPLTVAPADK